jgi:hypothetical protein
MAEAKDKALVAAKELNTEIDIFQDGALDEFAGAGISVAQEDNLMPFLGIIQKNSPQINKKQEKYIPGTEAGMLFNTATRVFYPAEDEEKDTGFLCIPITYSKQYVEWVPRDSGGGYVASHDAPPSDTRSVQVDGRDRLVRDNGNQIVETMYHLVLDAENFLPVVLAFTSTNLSVSRQWMTLRRQIMIPNSNKPAPAFSRVYRIGTVYKQRDTYDWYSFKVTDKGWVSKEALQVAKESFLYFKDNPFTVGRPSPEVHPDGDSSGTGGARGTGSKLDDADVPF